MKKEISIRTIDDDVVWDELVNSSPQGTVFCRSAWLSAVAGIQDGQPVRLGTMHNGELVAGVSFVEVQRGGFRKAVTPLLTPYAGMLYHDRPADGDESDTASLSLIAAEQLNSWMKRRYHQSTLVHSPAYFDVRPYTWGDWETRVRYTYCIDITDPDAAIRRFRKRVRHLINRADRDFTVVYDVDPDVLGTLHERTYRSRGEVPPFGGDKVAALIRALKPTGMLDIQSAVDKDGEIAGAVLNVIGLGTVYTLINGSTAEHRHTGVYALLNRDAIRRYHPDCHTLDLVGANIAPIAFYKRGFGGRLVPYYVTEQYSSLFARGAMNAYTRLRKLIRR